MVLDCETSFPCFIPGPFRGEELSATEGRVLVKQGVPLALPSWMVGVAVMVFAPDLPAVGILFAIDLPSLCPVQSAAICGTVAVYLSIDEALASVRTCGLTGGHLAGAEPIGRALLLVGLTVIH